MTSTYRYTGFHDGRRTTGMQIADNAAEAIETLTRRGLEIIKLEPVRRRQAFSFLKVIRNFFGNELSTRLTFFRGYAALESQGVPFEEAFTLLLKQMPADSRFGGAVRAVMQSLNEGHRDSLSLAMADHPDEFSPLEISLVAAGEKSRGRAEVLDRLAIFLERDAKLRKKLVGALSYPVMVVVFAICMLGYILFWLLPIFSGLYTSFNLPMPSMMSGALGLANVLKNPIDLTLIIGCCVVGGVFFSRWAGTPEGALRIDRALLGDGRIWKLPLKLWPFGEIRRKTITSRTFRALASLMSSGVPVEQAIDTAIPVASSPVYAKALTAARVDLSTGNTSGLSEALERHKAFDPYALGFLAIGERVAGIPEMLVRLSSYYDDDVESLLAALPEKIQTVVIVLLGVAVSYLAYIVYVPLSTLSTSVH